MQINEELDIKTYEGVYAPSDDTYLLLSMINVEGDEKVLEIGCGSGIISLHCRALGCDVLSVDKDEDALKNTETNAKKNDLDISFKKSDLFSNITEKDWDIIIFNPPYLPKNEFLSKDDRWDGGERGDEVVVKFLEKAKDYLTPDGKVFTCYSDRSPTRRIKEVIEEIYEISKIEQKEFFFETLYGIELK